MLPSNSVNVPVKHDVNVKKLIHDLKKDDNNDGSGTSRSTIIIDENENKEEAAILNNSISEKSLLDDNETDRPQTLPDEYLNKNLKTNYDESLKVYSATKSNSDIFPLNKNQNSAKKQNENDIKYNEQPMTIEDYTKHLLSNINQNNSILSKISVEVEQFAQSILKKSRNEITQVNKHDIDKELRKFMDNAVRFKFDITEEITKRLVNGALYAGSDENITVNCIMLPGSGI